MVALLVPPSSERKITRKAPSNSSSHQKRGGGLKKTRCAYPIFATPAQGQRAPAPQGPRRWQRLRKRAAITTGLLPCSALPCSERKRRRKAPFSAATIRQGVADYRLHVNCSKQSVLLSTAAVFGSFFGSVVCQSSDAPVSSICQGLSPLFTEKLSDWLLSLFRPPPSAR